MGAVRVADAMIGSGDFSRDLSSGVRSGNLFSNRGSAVLDAPERSRAAKEARAAGFKRGAAVTEMPLRREAAFGTNDFADDAGAEFGGRAQRGVRVSFRGGLLPKSLWGRIAAGGGLLLVAGCAIAAGLMVRSFLLRDPRFTVAGAQSIEIAGNSHLTRAQLLSVFGEDVDRNIFNIPLTERRAELERLPWVEHATVMRLLPNRVRVAIVERTPVAFVRAGTQIGLVDANGALFDLPEPEMAQARAGGATARGLPHYSFPVLTGILAADPLSTRAARMRIYMGFMAALDATGENVSRKLSEVDVSSPEDVRAVVPETGGDILVHFGEERFLERYHAYRDHLAEWRAQYPGLASADMRYERQVVLGMKPDTASNDNAAKTAASGTSAGSVAPSSPAAAAGLAAATPSNAAGQPASTVKAKPAAEKTSHPATAKARSAARAKAASKRSAAAHATAKTTGQTPHIAPQGAAQ